MAAVILLYNHHCHYHNLQQMEAGLSLSRGARLTHTLQSPWEIASQWVGPREVYPEETPELAAVLTSLSSARVERADVGYKGTQLKALLVLDGGQKVVFKPKRSDLLIMVLQTSVPHLRGMQFL